MQPSTVRMLEAFLAHELTPVACLCQGSVGASGDLAPLAHMSAAMIGVGCVLRRPKGRAGRSTGGAGLVPLQLGAKEGLALLNGTQFSTAYALAGLFETENLFGAALVSGALSTDAAAVVRFDPTSTACVGMPARSRRPKRCAGLMGGGGSAPASRG